MRQRRAKGLSKAAYGVRERIAATFNIKPDTVTKIAYRRRRRNLP